MVAVLGGTVALRIEGTVRGDPSRLLPEGKHVRKAELARRPCAHADRPSARTGHVTAELVAQNQGASSRAASRPDP
jgi:hypothetical protein